MNSGFDWKERPQQFLHAALALRDIGLVRLFLAGGASPARVKPSDEAALEFAVRLRFAEGIRLLDTEHQYRDLVAEIETQFPPEPDSPFIGQWTGTSRNGQSIRVTLRPDATGWLDDGRPIAIAWRKKNPDTIGVSFLASEPLTERFTLKLAPEQGRRSSIQIADKKPTILNLVE